MIYFVTTGTSLRESSRCWRTHAEEEDGRPRTTDFDEKGGFKEQVKKVLAHAQGQGTKLTWKEIDENLWGRGRAVTERLGSKPSSTSCDDYERMALRLVAEYFDEACWDLNHRYLLPAELATLFTMKKCGIIKEKDEIHFFGGKTNEADTVLSAATLQYLASRSQFPVKPTSIAASFERNWDPLQSGHSEGAISKLWDDYVATHVETNGSPSARFVLTGSYKGIGLDLALRLGKNHASTILYYLHEAASDQPPGYGLVTMKVQEGRLSSTGGL